MRLKAMGVQLSVGSQMNPRTASFHGSVAYSPRKRIPMPPIQRGLWFFLFCMSFTAVTSQTSSSGSAVVTTPPVVTTSTTMTPPVTTAATDPPGTDTPTTGTPETATPATETPETDTPETETPTTETPTTETPTTETPTTETPTTETPTTETPTTETPTTETPTTETPTTATPETETPKTETPKTATPETKAPETESPVTEAPPTTPPPPTTAAPKPTTQAPTPTLTDSPETSSPVVVITRAPTAKTPDTPTPTTETPATKAPVVEHYNSSTLPPGVSASMLNGSDLVAVEVTETNLGNGTTSYSYVIITRSGDAEKVIVLSPVVSATDQSGSSLSDSNATSKSSSSLSVGAVVGIIVGGVVLMLVLFAFFYRRRSRKHRPSDASMEDVLESPQVEKQVWHGRSPAETEYRDMTRTTANSRSSGGSLPNSISYRATLWEDPVILASRIPIDRIELGVIVGRGAFGEVYRGRYRGLDVAVKTLVPEKRKDLAHIQAFLSEVRLMATMEHPQVVQFIGVAWESLSEVNCVTEFMGGGDLRALLIDYLNSGVPQGMDDNKVKIAYQVAHALTYLHSLSPVVLHRDLKSRNILLTETLEAKITDFGASRIRSDASMTSGVGSALWMAPEVMMGRHYDEKADIFSLGVVISELDTHEMPYSHAKEGSSSGGHPLPDTAVLQMVSVGKLRVRFSPFIHPEMARFVDRCVSVDPQERPTAAEVLYFLQMAIRDRQY